MAARQNISVCPQPLYWHELHQRLAEATRMDGTIPPPPLPLIFAGWTYSNDVEKQARWQETIAWAGRHGFSELVENVPDDHMYSVAALSSYKVGPLGGPMHLDWTFDAKPRVSPADQAAVIQKLQSSWPAIAGDALAAVTQPLRLTGKKGRRLLVLVTSDITPPWGSWTELAHGEEKRRTFTAFRSTINQAISPLEVDHIDFVKRESEQAQSEI